jgi:hypothetical protein
MIQFTCEPDNRRARGARHCSKQHDAVLSVRTVDGGVDLHAQQLGAAVHVGGHLDAGHHAAGHALGVPADRVPLHTTGLC